MSKTPDEIKKGLEICNSSMDCNDCPYLSNRFCIPSCKCSRNADALAYIQQLEARVPRWISVEERLPKVDKRYDGYEYSAELLVYDGLRRRAAYYCHTSGVWYDSRYEDDTFEVTHWMPMPEPPKEDQA